MAAFTVRTSTAISSYSPAGTAVLPRCRRRTFHYRVSCSASSAANRTVVIGLAADSGCGKGAFTRRLTSVLGGLWGDRAEPPQGGNPDSNTLISETTTAISLDDYLSLDRAGRKAKGVTALDPSANDFDLMYEQVKAIKEGRAVEKPVYNRVTGRLDPPELITPPKILLVQGLHPMYATQLVCFFRSA